MVGGSAFDGRLRRLSCPGCVKRAKMKVSEVVRSLFLPTSRLALTVTVQNPTPQPSAELRNLSLNVY